MAARRPPRTVGAGIVEPIRPARASPASSAIRPLAAGARPGPAPAGRGRPCRRRAAETSPLSGPGAMRCRRPSSAAHNGSTASGRALAPQLAAAVRVRVITDMRRRSASKAISPRRSPGSGIGPANCQGRSPSGRRRAGRRETSGCGRNAARPQVEVAPPASARQRGGGARRRNTRARSCGSGSGAGLVGEDGGGAARSRPPAGGAPARCAGPCAGWPAPARGHGEQQALGHVGDDDADGEHEVGPEGQADGLADHQKKPAPGPGPAAPPAGRRGGSRPAAAIRCRRRSG